MIERIAFYQNRNDEEPNIDLASQLVRTKDIKGIKEIVIGLDNKEKKVSNDCIKVLYEIGYLSPDLINPYIDIFLDKLHSRNNRIVWGCCIAISILAKENSDKIYNKIELIKKVYKDGSVITIDNCISIFAGVIKGNNKYSKVILPILLKHLENCRPKEVAQHAERSSICITKSNKKMFIKVLNDRLPSLTDAQSRRVKKLIKQMEEI